MPKGDTLQGKQIYSLILLACWFLGLVLFMSYLLSYTHMYDLLTAFLKIYITYLKLCRKMTTYSIGLQNNFELYNFIANSNLPPVLFLYILLRRTRKT